MNRQLKQTACPWTPQGSSLDQHPVLQSRMTATHPDKELALPGYLSIGYFERRLNQRAIHNRTLCRGNDAGAD